MSRCCVGILQIISAVVIALSLPGPAWAVLPTEPLLRVETSMHTASLRAIALDQQRSAFFTAADDKTVRGWSLDDGRLVETLRIPVGAGDEGRLYALAVSPDGKWLATGGATQAVTVGAGNYHIYLFDRQHKKLGDFIASLPNVVNHLCFSPDGRYLAASLGSEGVRVWSTNGWSLVGQDRDYRGPSHWCDFSADGRLVTTSLDGHVRLYRAPSFERVSKVRTEVGTEPFGAAFSPAGDRIAIGFADRPRVSVLSADNLSREQEPNARGLSKGGLSKVAWSQDGARLFAAGRYQAQGRFPVIVWSQGGAGARSQWAGTANSVTDLSPLADGGLLLGTDYPAWLRLNANGNQVDERKGAVPDFRDKLGDALRVSADGRRVAFGLGYGDEQMVLFDLERRRLFEGTLNETWLLQRELRAQGYDPGPVDGLMGPSTSTALRRWRMDVGLGPGGLDSEVRARLGISPLKPAQINAPGINVKRWQNQDAPTLNGRGLDLDSRETARALAIAPDEQSFVVGTSWFLRAYDRSGRSLWKQSVPETAWGVNISADGRFLVAALGDGTLRWYRYDDGEPLLALFVHERSQEWVVWTPDGYYDASPGGDRLVGWHLNRFEPLPGLAIQYVVPHSAAERAGLAAGDVIASINGQAISGRDDLVAVLRTAPFGQPLEFLVVRGASSVVVPVDLNRSSPSAPPRLGTVVGQALASVQTSDFYPVNVFRKRFYRPEIVEEVLLTGNLSSAVASADQRGEPAMAVASVTQTLPPIVEILSPTDGDAFTEKTLDLRYQIRSPAGDDIRNVQILVDGRPLDTSRGLKRVRVKPAEEAPANTQTSSSADGVIRTTSVTLPARDVSLSIVAENQFGASPPTTVKLRWAGKQSEGFQIKPKLYALAIGVSDYEDDLLDLAFATKDATDFAAAINRQHNGIYREINVKVLPDPDSDEFLAGLDWLRDEVTSHDVAMLFVAGHGVNDEDGDYYFLTKDAQTDRLRRTAVPYYEIKKTMSALPGKALAFIDTCHSGNVMGARRGVADINAVVNDLAAAENGVIVYTSSTGKQYSLENPQWENGAFTEALVEGLDGAADYTGDGVITVNQLDLYLSERVKKLTDNRQTPTSTKPQTVTDFPIAVKH